MTMAKSLLDIVLSPILRETRLFRNGGSLPGSELLISSRGGSEGCQVGVSCGAGGFAGGDGPKRGIIQQAADKLRMQGVAGLVGLDACQKRQARQSQVTNEVQGFVSSKLVREAQRSIHDAIVAKNDGILKGASANQAHSFEPLDFALDTESFDS